MKDALIQFDTFLQSLQVDDSRVPYLHLACAFLVIEFLFHTYLDIRQRKVVQTGSPPDELKEHYATDHLEKTRAYSIDKKNYGLVKGLYSFAETAAILYFQLLPVIWDWSTQLVAAVKPAWAKSEIIVTVAFVLLTSVVSTIKDLPWGLYFTFVIEQRHGFNKQTVGLFFSDMLKSLALTFVLAPPIVALLTYVMLTSGPYLPLYLWAVIFVLQLVIMTLYPTLIAPLFNKYDPLPEGALREAIQGLAGQLSFPLKKLYVMDGSKRSGHSNAYMYGFFNNKRIVLYDTLINQCTEDQVVAVLAHELGHWKLSHTLCLMAFGQLVMFLQFCAFTLFRSSSHLFAEFGFVDAQPVIMAFMLFSMVMGPVDQLIGWVSNLVSRRFEFQADAFAVGMRSGTSLVEALKILDKENKSDFVVDPLYSAYHYSHPPLVERLRAIEKGMQQIAKKAM